MTITKSRRRFLAALAAAGAAPLLSVRPSLAADRPPETTAGRLTKLAAVCLAPQYVAEEFLRAEGFTEINYVDTDAAHIGLAIGRGEVDFSTANPVDFLQAIDTGASIVVLGGVHVGCYELFVRDGIHSITELKGKTVGLRASPPAQRHRK